MLTPSLKNKSKRVQKKLYIGDFAILGFEISGQFTQKEESQLDSSFDDLMEFIESKNLCFGGGYSKKGFDGFITSIERYSSNTEADRQALDAWLSNQDTVSNIEVGNLVDANYGL